MSETAPVATPCVRLCTVEPLSGLCLGCGRTLREIGGWAGFSPHMRATIMAGLPERLARLMAARPQAFAETDEDEGR